MLQNELFFVKHSLLTDSIKSHSRLLKKYFLHFKLLSIASNSFRSRQLRSDNFESVSICVNISTAMSSKR